VILHKKDVYNLNIHVIIALTATYFLLMLLSSVFHINLAANFAHKINCRRIKFRGLYIKQANKSALHYEKLRSYFLDFRRFFYELKIKVLCADHVDIRVYLSVRLEPIISDKTLCRTFKKFCKGVVYKKLECHSEDCDYRLIESYCIFSPLPVHCNLSEDIQQHCWQSLLMACRRYIQWYISY